MKLNLPRRTKRRRPQRLLGNDITVTILGVKGSRSGIGINAPKRVAVHREEIYERIRREQNGPNAVVNRTPTTPSRIGSCRRALRDSGGEQPLAVISSLPE